MSRIDELNSITGFLVPIFSEDPIPGRRARHGLGPRDYEKVMAGYACPECLADFGGNYRPVCPVCRFERNVEQDIAFTAPGLWTDSLAAREAEGSESKAASPDELFKALANDPNVDRIKL